MAGGTLYCKLFIDYEGERSSVENLIASALDGQIHGFGEITTQTLDVSVRKNDDHNPVLKTNPTDGSLFYRYYLEIEPCDDGVSPTTYIRDIGNLLCGLWSQGVGAVAACDFENELPSKSSEVMKRYAHLFNAEHYADEECVD